MKENKLSKLSFEELKKNEKNLKMILFAFIGVLCFLIGVIIYSIVKKGITAIIIIPITLLPLLILFYNNLNDIKSEIESRK
ncbi:redox-active disulfide protein 2 [Lutibacter citreus]|uniref:redox-active disulfide protein 2 n=1 Tax=Lutibacter citreus TaxID=2138210 RepID=UPI000DBE2699|nr:redox-active disulfide protein 2 [Lutibacter citreus]